MDGDLLPDSVMVYLRPIITIPLLNGLNGVGHILRALQGNGPKCTHGYYP